LNERRDLPLEVCGIRNPESDEGYDQTDLNKRPDNMVDGFGTENLQQKIIEDVYGGEQKHLKSRYSFLSSYV
jgi:hypothetical protein